MEEVEEFIDACLSIDDLIDIHSPFVKRYDERDVATREDEVATWMIFDGS